MDWARVQQALEQFEQLICDTLAQLIEENAQLRAENADLRRLQDEKQRHLP
jgi:regulator of replication initiation timing